MELCSYNLRTHNTVLITGLTNYCELQKKERTKISCFYVAVYLHAQPLNSILVHEVHHLRCCMCAFPSDEVFTVFGIQEEEELTLVPDDFLYILLSPFSLCQFLSLLFLSSRPCPSCQVSRRTCH